MNKKDSISNLLRVLQGLVITKLENNMLNDKKYQFGRNILLTDYSDVKGVIVFARDIVEKNYTFIK